MPPIVIKLQDAEDTSDVVHHSVEAISSGKIVSLPTETGYGLAVSALIPNAVNRLMKLLKGASEFKNVLVPIAFAVKSIEDALDFVPNFPIVACRLARRSWPGPLALVLDQSHPDSVIQRLDDQVKSVTLDNNTIALRCPANEFTQRVQRLSAGPVLLVEPLSVANGESQSTPAIEQQFGGEVDLVLDDGRRQFRESLSLVRVDSDNHFHVIHSGSFDAETVNRLAHFFGLVVCTGNTCRSPMAEALFKKLVAEKIGCHVDVLIDQGIQIASAGIAAMPGSPAADQATEVMNQFGMEISGHASQPISSRAAEAADLILTMTNNHRDAIVARWPKLEPRTKTLRADGGNISDPIGSPVSVYEACAKQIENNLRYWVDQVDWNQFKTTT